MFSPSYDYYLNGKPVAVITTHRDLGVVVSSDLKWKSHYEVVLSKAHKILGLLQRVFSSALCVKAKKVLYISLVRSQLLYCSQIWCPHLLTDIRTLGVQRRATKFILNDYQSDYHQRLPKSNTLPLMMLFEINDIVFFIKCIKKPSEYFDISK